MFAGIDLGSRWIGCIASDFPVRLGAEPATIRVDDVGQAVSDVVAYIVAARARVVVIEHGKFYVMAGATSAAITAMAQAHEVCALLHDRLTQALDALGIKHATVARATWVHRVLPRTPGGITDRMAHDALAMHVTEPGDLERLTDVHQRDALGTLLGWCLPKPRREPGPKRVHGSRAKITQEDWAIRKAASHERRRIRNAARNMRNRGEPGEPATRLQGITGRSCSRCGGPRKGHVRGLPCPPVTTGA